MLIKERNHWIDVFKGIGAILVLFGHLVPWDGRLKVFIYSFHMPLFFFASGYLFHYAHDIKIFIYKKAQRLLKPYLFYSIISFVFSYFLEQIIISKREVLYNIFFIKGKNIFNSSLWFLVVLFWVLLFAEFLNFLIKKYKIEVNSKRIIISLILLLIINIIIAHFKIKLLLGLEVVPHALLIFYLGYLYKKHESFINNKIKKIKWYQWGLLFLFSIILGQLNGKVTMSYNEFNNYFIYLIVAIINTFLLVLVCKKINRNMYLEKLGDLSLVMFCTQRLIFKVIVFFQQRFDFILLQSPVLIIDIILGLLLIGVYLLYDKLKGEVRMHKKTLGLLVLIMLFSLNINVVDAKSSGWEESNGKYYYYDATTNQYLTGWQKIDGLDYYFNPETKERLQGIHVVDGNKYFFGVTKGKVMYGWVYYDNKIYYTDPNTGILASGVTKVGNDHYFFGINTNRMMYGLITDYEGNKFYTNSDGILQSGFKTIDDKTYYFDKENFSALTGWQKIDGLDYYFNPETKERLQGIHVVDGNKYFFGVTKGKVMYGWVYYDNKIYYTDPNTGILASGVTKVGNDHYFFGINTNRMMYGLITDYEGNKFYTNSDGILQSGFKTIDDKTYYFDKENFSALTGWQKIDGLNYYFNPETKERLQGIHVVDGNKYFFGVTKGKVMYGWVYYDNKIYYTDPNTGILASGVTKVGNDHYFFGINTNRMMYGLITDYEGNKFYTNSDGILQSGMTKLDDNWYYFDLESYQAASGEKILEDGEYYFYPDTKIRASNVTKVGDKYYFYGIKYGKKQFGLVTYDNEYYYANPTTGELAEGWTTIDGNLYYYLPDSKKRAKGVTEVEGDGVYFFGIKYGLIQRGWVNYDGLTYYADPDTGHLYTGWHTIDGNKYFFGLKTKRVMKGWFTDPDTNILYFLDYDTGIPANGFREVDSHIYYFEEGRYITGNRTIDGRAYYFYPNGVMKANFVDIDGYTYYYYEDGRKADDWVTIGQTKYFFNSLGHMVGKNVKKVIDVSKWNNERGVIDWATVKTKGDVDAAIIRAAYRGYGSAGTLVEDPYFAENVQGAKAQGIQLGAYFFSQAINVSEGREEANMIVDLINREGGKNTFSLPIVFDSEFSTCQGRCGRADHLSKKERTDIAIAFLETVKSRGYTPMLYASKNFLYDNLDMSRLLGYKLWVAQYNHYCNFDGTYDMWQYSSTETVTGMPGATDVSVWYS